MTVIPEPFAIVNGQVADGDQLEADLAIIRSVCNGGLEAGTNVQAATTGSALTGNNASGGSSGFVSRGDHQHVVRGFEQFAADPTSGNFVGRHYFDTVNSRVRLCIGTPATWVTAGNLAAADLPVHSSRHATGGADPLPSNSIAETMLAARTVYQGVPSAEVTVSANAWTDIVTGLAITVTGTQIITFYAHLDAVNGSGSNTPAVAVRIIDASSAVLFQTGLTQFGVSGGGGDNKHVSFACAVSVNSSPTVRLQVDANAGGISVKKSRTTQTSAFASTMLQAVVG